MVDITTWQPENAQRLVEELMAEIKTLHDERNSFRDSWRAAIVELERLKEAK